MKWGSSRVRSVEDVEGRSHSRHRQRLFQWGRALVCCSTGDWVCLESVPFQAPSLGRRILRGKLYFYPQMLSLYTETLETH